MLFDPLPSGPFDLVLADPPWLHTGSKTKDQAAGKHYECLSNEQLALLPVKTVMARKCVCLMWATGPLMHKAIELLGLWGFAYRGIEFVWVKTTKNGKIIEGQGVKPSIVKPTTEFIIAGSFQAKGRPLPLATESMGQVVLAPRPSLNGKPIHSAKPAIFRKKIEQLYPKVDRIELFARENVPGWTPWGNQAGSLNELTITHR